MTNTRWNGEPCEARRVTAVVIDDGRFPGYWARGHVGTRRAVVEVTYGGSTFYLDDEDGSGWAKVTSGGSPSHGHRSVTVDPGSIQPGTDPAATEATSTTKQHDRPRTHIRAMIEVLKEEPPEQLAQPAGLFISGMLTGLAASVQILDGGTAEQAIEAVPTRLEAAIGRAFLNGTLPSKPPRTDPAGELRQIDALLQDLGVEGELGARGMATLANTVRTMREELQTAENFEGRAKAALALFRKGEEPLPEGQHPATASPAQWLWLWNEASPAERLARAERIITSSQEASACFLDNHRARLAELEDLQHRVSRTERERDGAYGERAHLVALLAAMTDGTVIAPAVDVAEPGWQIVYLTIGGRQASWHINPRDASLFDDVEHVSADDPRAHWDGHSTEDKYARIHQHTRLLARRYGPACAEAHTYTGRCEGAHQVDDSDTTAPDVVHPAADPQASGPQQVDEPCPKHPHAPTFDGMCGGCTQYPTDMTPAAPASEEQRDAQQ